MVDVNVRLLLLAVAVTALAGLLVGWIGGLAGSGLVGLPGVVGFVAGMLLLGAILLVVWVHLSARRPIG